MQELEGYVEHPLLKDEVIEQRLYQLELSSTALNQSSLIVLPTGTGKTAVSLLVTAARLADNPASKSLLLAPTKPLVNQHADFYREALDIPPEEIVVFTGEVPPRDRGDMWRKAKIVVSTPQVIENDIIGERISLEEVVHLTFDECHRSKGNYPYNYIAQQYLKEAQNPLVTGMTASPGSDKAEILDICDNLGIETVEIMTREDSDLARHMHDIDVEWKKIQVPDEVKEITGHIDEVMKDRLTNLRDTGVIQTTDPDSPVKKLLRARGRIQSLIDEGDAEGYHAMSLHAEVMKLRHAKEIVETQGVNQLNDYFAKLEQEKTGKSASKAVKRMMSNLQIQKAKYKAEEYDDTHPKMDVMRSMVIDEISKDEDSRVIVFTEYRDTARRIQEFLSEHKGINPKRFVGQSNKENDPGLTQKQQKQAIQEFKDGVHNVLVATSVAEEGLDIPEVDLVLFYEPVPSEIRAIQRRGRTGRKRAGKVAVLIAKDTRDEAYFWSAKRKEENMKRDIRELKGVKNEINEELQPEQSSLDEFDSPVHQQQSHDDVEITIDQRETKSGVARNLKEKDDTDITLETLEVGDYVLSDRVAAERKTPDDLLSTLTGDRDLFQQIHDMKRNYPRSIIIIEGEINALYSSGIHPNAVRGALASITIDMNVPVLMSRDAEDTSNILYTVAKREQSDQRREARVHGEKETGTLKEQQEYVVASIADIGPVTARALLREFGSVRAVMTSDKDELMDVEGVGVKTAEKILEITTSDYTD